jgi:integrase
MFNVAIDSKLRGCDVVALKVEDIAPNGYAMERATVRQKKTGQPVRFELTEQTRQAVDDYLRAFGRRPGEFLFPSRRNPKQSLATRQYARLVDKWVASIGLDDPFRDAFAQKNQSELDLQANRQLACGPATARSYKDREHCPVFGIEVDDALAIAAQVDV